MKDRLQTMKGAIFDLDGTLLDSMGVWGDVDRIFFERRNMAVPEDYVQVIAPLGFAAAASYTVKRFHFEEREEDIVEEWHELAREAYAKAVWLKPYAREYLDNLKKKGVRLAAATASDHALFGPCLANNGLSGYFDEIVTVRDVKRGKGFPDIYELAAERLGMKASDCVVFEDILKGIEGAKAGGFFTVAIEDPHSAGEKDRIEKTADRYLRSWKELL